MSLENFPKSPIYKIDLELPRISGFKDKFDNEYFFDYQPQIDGVDYSITVTFSNNRVNISRLICSIIHDRDNNSQEQKSIDSSIDPINKLFNFSHDQQIINSSTLIIDTNKNTLTINIQFSDKVNIYHVNPFLAIEELVQQVESDITSLTNAVYSGKYSVASPTKNHTNENHRVTTIESHFEIEQTKVNLNYEFQEQSLTGNHHFFNLPLPAEIILRPKFNFDIQLLNKIVESLNFSSLILQSLDVHVFFTEDELSPNQHTVYIYLCKIDSLLATLEANYLYQNGYYLFNNSWFCHSGLINVNELTSEIGFNFYSNLIAAEKQAFANLEQIVTNDIKKATNYLKTTIEKILQNEQSMFH